MTTATPKPRFSLREILMRNPVMLKELRGRMRGARSFAVLTVYLLLMSGFITILYAVYIASTSNSFSISDRQYIGKFVFGSVVGIEILLVCFIAPAFTVGAVSGERERQTFDLLRTTLLSAPAFVLGKLGSALSYVFLLLFAALPLQSLAFLLGGVALEEVLIANLLLATSAFLFSAAGIFISSLTRRTLGATVLTYAFILFMTLALPVLLMVTLPVMAIWNFNQEPPLILQIILFYLLGLLIVTNPVASLITTEIVLVNNQTIWYFPVSLYDQGNTFPVPALSPWSLSAVFCVVLGLALLVAAILSVNRREQ